MLADVPDPLSLLSDEDCTQHDDLFYLDQYWHATLASAPAYDNIALAAAWF